MIMNYRYLILRSRSRFLLFAFCFTCLFLSAVHGSAQVKGDSLRVTGLTEAVEVIRDAWGVNHIYAKNEHDLFFAQGYCAARDRLFQFEIWRRQATGTVSELFGRSEVQRDIGARLFKYRGSLDEEFSHYHPNGIKIIEAFTNGVNAWIDEVLADQEKLPESFKITGLQPGKWTPEVVISRHQGLLGNITEELDIGRAVAIAGARKVKDLMWFHPKEPNLDLDPRITSDMLAEDILGLYNAHRKRFPYEKFRRTDSLNTSPDNAGDLSFLPKEEAVRTHAAGGSNNWIISGSRTISGHPILANDPHRSITLPSLRYMVHLNAPGWHVIGGGEPVIPGVSIGHNDAGAWGLTIFETDGEDLYVYDLNPRNLSQYRYQGRWKNMTVVKDTIKIKNAPDSVVSLYYTVHGPVTFFDSARRKAYAVRCAWLEPGGAPYLASLRMDQANTWEEFRDACSYSHIPAENMIWADRKGNIGWQAVGIIPVRKNFSGMVPVPGDGKYEWSGYFDIKERPHILNPEKGFFATANQNVTPGSYTYWDAIGYTWADPFRGDRINEVLSADSLRTIDKEAALQLDYFSIPARTFVPMLKGLPLSCSLARDARDMLMQWDYFLDKESLAAGIYAMWERELSREAQHTLIPEKIKGLVYIQLEKLIIFLNTSPERFQKSGGRNAFLIKTFESAVAKLSEKLGPSIVHWKYGQPDYKHISLFHPLTRLLTPTERDTFNLGPVPRGGNSFSPNATGSYDNQYSGASFRMIMDVGDWDRALMINTPGQSENPGSKYYDNLFRKWAYDQYFPAYFSKQRIEDVLDEKWILLPQKK